MTGPREGSEDPGGSEDREGDPGDGPDPDGLAHLPKEGATVPGGGRRAVDVGRERTGATPTRAHRLTRGPDQNAELSRREPCGPGASGGSRTEVSCPPGQTHG